MDIGKIEYFFAAAETGNITRASERCGIAQTTMSKYIQTLERETGCELLLRTNKGCQLTEQGTLFYEGMKRIHEDYEGLLKRVISMGEKQIWIGIEGNIHAIPEFMLYTERHPEIDLSVLFGDREELLDSLYAGRTDMLIIAGIPSKYQFRDKNIEMIELPGKIEWMVCADSLLEQYGSQAEVIANTPMITKNNDADYNEYCREGLRKRFGTTFSDIQWVDSISKQMLMLRLAQGFAVVPFDEIDKMTGLTAIKMDETFMTTQKLIYNKKNVTPELKDFLKFIQARFDETLNGEPHA